MNVYYFLLFIMFAPALEFCQPTKANQEDKFFQDEPIIVAQEENKKYNLTATLHGVKTHYGHYNEIESKIITYVTIRDNRSGDEIRYKPLVEVEGTMVAIESEFPSAVDLYFTNVWSPNAEYLILPIDKTDGFAIFAAKDVLNNIKDNKHLDTIKVKSLNSGWYWHDFEKWENDSTFAFRAGLSNDLFAFKYNVAKSELYCYQTKCEEFKIGKNIKGDVKPIKKGDIETLKVH